VAGPGAGFFGWLGALGVGGPGDAGMTGTQAGHTQAPHGWRRLG